MGLIRIQMPPIPSVAGLECCSSSFALRSVGGTPARRDARVTRTGFVIDQNHRSSGRA